MASGSLQHSEEECSSGPSGRLIVANIPEELGPLVCIEYPGIRIRTGTYDHVAATLPHAIFHQGLWTM